MERTIRQTIKLADQYLNPTYNEKGDIEAQKQQEETIFTQIVAELAKEDQDVLKIWKVVKKAKREGD